MVKISIENSNGNSMGNALKYEHIDGLRASSNDEYAKTWGFILLCKICEKHESFRYKENAKMHEWITVKHYHDAQEVQSVTNKLDEAREEER